MPYLPSTLLSFLPAQTEMSRMAYYALSAGLLSAIPSVLTGSQQAVKSIKTQGMYEQDNQTIKPKVKTIVAHAVANDAVLAVSAYFWYARRQSSSLNLAYSPESWVVGVEALLAALLMYSANLGGTLTYNYGMGVSIGKSSKKSQ